jgi:hypothetical protein
MNRVTTSEFSTGGQDCVITAPESVAELVRVQSIAVAVEVPEVSRLLLPAFLLSGAFCNQPSYVVCCGATLR